MPKIAGDALTKVTINLYEADVSWFQEEYGQGWSSCLRDVIHREVNHRKQLEQMAIKDGWER